MEKGRMNRRQFLGGIGGATTAALLLGGLASTSPLNSVDVFAQTGSACPIDTIDGGARASAAYNIRETAARMEADQAIPTPSCNGDEAVYPEGQASFTKSLPHDEFGEADPAAFAALMTALRSGDPDDFRNIPMGGPDLLLANPQCSYAFELEGPDSHALSIRPAPSFLSPETAGEMVECYWHALLRDVNFNDYDDDNNDGPGGPGGQQPPGGPGGGNGGNGNGNRDANLVQAALNDLNALSDFRGPKQNGQVTPQTLFRGDTPGDLTGPFISQFLIQQFNNGPISIDQRFQVPRPGQDFMTTFEEWRDVQSGTLNRSIDFDDTPRYIRNGRDLGEYVHRDYPFSAALNAGLVLFSMGAPVDEANPYFANPTQDGFGTFGLPHMTYLVTSVANRALKAAWCQKWLINRRLRPEVMGARIHVTETGIRSYFIDNEVLESRAIQELKDRFDSYLLPQAYPEGSPAHPSYPAGHATFSGACITMLKAFFDETWVIPSPMRVANDGTELRNYNGPALTVGGELNKLASNIALGRDIAGVHYRSDGIEGINLGEQLAIGVLNELKETYNERFTGFQFTKFNGETVRI